jgi:NTP pyrophosphatase (non-canonical NTP hydrolase)
MTPAIPPFLCPHCGLPFDTISVFLAHLEAINRNGELDSFDAKLLPTTAALEREDAVTVLSRLTQASLRTDCDYAQVLPRLQDIRIVRLLHVASGLVTEAAEFLDQLKRVIYYGKPLDTTNLLEELGDTSWYMRLGADELQSDLLAIMEANVRKLRTRYPDKFTEHAAENRNLPAERKSLEEA